MSSTRPRAANASATASITAGSQPSETFGTDSSRATDLLYGAGVTGPHPATTARSRPFNGTSRTAGAASTPAIRSSPSRSSMAHRESTRISTARHLGSSKELKGAPWRGRAGRTLRRWLELDEETFYATFYCASVTRCYPGRTAGGRGDRTPTPAERRLCAPWREEELRLLRPDLILTVGGLAAHAIIGVRALTECVGKSYLVGRRDRDPAAAPLGRERVAQRHNQPHPPRQGAHACAPRAGSARRRNGYARMTA